MSNSRPNRLTMIEWKYPGDFIIRKATPVSHLEDAMTQKNEEMTQEYKPIPNEYLSALTTMTTEQLREVLRGLTDILFSHIESKPPLNKVTATFIESLPPDDTDMQLQIYFFVVSYLLGIVTDITTILKREWEDMDDWEDWDDLEEKTLDDYSTYELFKELVKRHKRQCRYSIDSNGNCSINFPVPSDMYCNLLPYEPYEGKE